MLHMEQISYNIILILSKEKKHIRGLAKILNTNPMTIARKVKQLEKKNIVDYNLEGKNKVYFLKKSLEANQYLKAAENLKIITLISKHPRLRNIIDVINKDCSIGLAIIFGSYAQEKETKNSDIDIYIETTNRKIKEKLELLDSKLSIKIGPFITENNLIKEIIKNNIIIKGVDRYYKLIY